MKIIIIEDESLLVEELEGIITEIDSQLQVIKTLGSIQESLSYFQENPLPDLFFSDIQLPAGLRFDIFRQLETSTPVVFCTAYDQYALDAFKFNGIDYILKPYNSDEIARTINKYQLHLIHYSNIWGNYNFSF